MSSSAVVIGILKLKLSTEAGRSILWYHNVVYGYFVLDGGK